MSTHIITAATGEPHVTSADDGALHASVVGDGRYKLEVGDGLAVSMADANTLKISTGALMMDGRFIRVDSAEALKIANGGQGSYRKDLAVLHYHRDASNNGYETVEWEVLQGTSVSTEAAAAVPTFTKGNILNGDADARVAVAEVDLSGLTPTAKLLLDSVPTIASLRDSVSQTVKVAATAVYSDIRIRAYARGGMVDLEVERPMGTSGEAMTTHERGVIGHLPEGYRPADTVEWCCGTGGNQGDQSAWLMVRVSTDGEVVIYHLYDTVDNQTWSYFYAHACFAAA